MLPKHLHQSKTEWCSSPKVRTQNLAEITIIDCITFTIAVFEFKRDKLWTLFRYSSTVKYKQKMALTVSVLCCWFCLLTLSKFVDLCSLLRRKQHQASSNIAIIKIAIPAAIPIVAVIVNTCWVLVVSAWKFNLKLVSLEVIRIRFVNKIQCDISKLKSQCF